MRGFSPSASRRATVLHTHGVLHRALKQARHWGLTSRIPTELVSVPRLPYREKQALSKDQLEILFESSHETRWYPHWVLLGTTGLRIGEALGLKWTDVDLVGGRLQGKRALQRQRGRGLVFVEPKSVTSRRCIELPKLAITICGTRPRRCCWKPASTRSWSWRSSGYGPSQRSSFLTETVSRPSPARGPGFAAARPGPARP